MLTVFLSAATIDLKNWRDVLHGAFARAGFRVFTQNHSLGAAPGDVKRLLCEHIDQCDCVIHLAGLGYGSHADEPFASVPAFQCSWTQFEYYYAHAKDKDVIAFVCAPGLSAAGFVEEGDDAERQLKARLQKEHRDRVASGKFDGTPLAGRKRTLNETVDSVEKLLQAVSAAVATLHRLTSEQERLQGELTRERFLHQLPPRPTRFVGREDELRRLRALDPGDGALITGLRGMGGIGKSALAVVLAHEWLDRFPHAQLFLDGRGTHANPPTGADLLARVIQTFHPEAKLPDDEATLRGLYQQLLDGKRVLVVLDNARDAAQARPLIPPTGCGLIVTSRHNFLIGQAAPLQVGRLLDGDAATLLEKYCPALSAADTAALVKRCTGLPLALRLAGAHLALDAAERGGVADVAGYLKALGAGRLAALDQDAPDADEVTISETLRLSEDQLPQAKREAWRKLGVFGASFDAGAAEAVAGAAEAVLGRLVRRSLLERAGTDRYELHDLAAEYARGKLDATTLDAACLKHAEHYASVGKEADRLYLKGDVVAGLALFNQERPQIEAAFGWLSLRQDLASDRALINLVNAVAQTSNLRFHPRQRITWYEAHLAAARRLADRSNEGFALSNLGIAFFDLGDSRRAIEYQEKSLVVSREIGSRSAEGPALNNLGLAYADLGDGRRAIEYYEKYLTIAREDGNRIGEVSVLGNLGNAHADLGDTRRAIEYYEPSLTIAREIGYRRGEGAALGNLGAVHADLGDMRRAIEYYEQYIPIAREVGDRRGEAITMGNLGNAQAALGDTRRAMEYYVQQLEICREIGDRRGEGKALFNSALALWKLGDREEAICRAEAALKIYVAIESSDTESVRRTLAEWRVAE
jgi:tetratricopeptide (TPR) repeat protein